jgi:hypothetical protein
MNSFQITACLELQPTQWNEEWIGTRELDVDITGISVWFDAFWGHDEIVWM